MSRTVTVLTKAGCPPCAATERTLKRLEVAYESIDIATDADAQAMASALGHRQAPVVIITGHDGIEDHWSGYRPDRLAALSG